MASSTDRPQNIVLLVWDACRYDSARDHAPELSSLADDNVWFERAIAPSPWSLPSHASLFTGRYPHEHGSHRLDGTIQTPLLDELSERGYVTYGISANGFASQRTSFHDRFDQFYYTGGRDLYHDGLNVSGFAQRFLTKDDDSKATAIRKTLGRIARHDHRLKSIANLASVGLGELAQDHPVLQRIPHRTFAPDSGYCYAPERNTRLLESIVAEAGEEPFFAFVNYMDTHRPYKPRAELQREHLGETLSYRELLRLNETVAYPWEFVDELENGEVDEDDVETVRGLYAGEVQTVDEQLRRVRETLQSEGLLDDTLIIVTSDHGENLGEADERGNRRMGHEASVSDAVLHVPLLLAHSELDGRTVSEPVSLKDLYGLVLDGIPDLMASGGGEIPGLLPFEGTVSSQYPATGGGEKFFEKHPNVPKEIIEHRVSEHSAVAYDEDWKVVVESTGAAWAVEGEGREQTVDAAPEHLVETAREHLEILVDAGGDSDLTEADVEQLEALGYL